MAAYTIVANARKASALGAYHDLFTILLWLSIIMLAASIGKAATGKEDRSFRSAFACQTLQQVNKGDRINMSKGRLMIINMIGIIATLALVAVCGYYYYQINIMSRRMKQGFPQI
ncbi:hypothetical protein PO124_09645 [Bacillus licheniformis]|nr:hypothetical protein [Bacillus licheniformis]